MSHTYPKDYAQALAMLNNRKTKKIAGNTYLLEPDAAKDIRLQYHETTIVVFHENNAITFTNCNEWRSKTTKERLDAVSSQHGIRISQRNFSWQVARIENGKEMHVFSYCEGFKITPTGDIAPTWGVDTPVDNTRQRAYVWQPMRTTTQETAERVFWDTYYHQGIDPEHTSESSQTVRFSTISADAEKEMQEWDNILKGQK